MYADPKNREIVLALVGDSTMMRGFEFELDLAMVVAEYISAFGFLYHVFHQEKTQSPVYR